MTHHLLTIVAALVVSAHALYATPTAEDSVGNEPVAPELAGDVELLGDLFVEAMSIGDAPELTVDDLRHALAVGCSVSITLTSETFVASMPPVDDVVAARTYDPAVYSVAWINEELPLLSESLDLPEEAMGRLGELWHAVGPAPEHDAEYQYRVLHERVETFKAFSCSGGDFDPDPQLPFFQRIGKRIVDGVIQVAGGGLIIGADLAFAPATSALSIVSVSIGSGVVSSGIVTLLSPAPVEEEDASG